MTSGLEVSLSGLGERDWQSEQLIGLRVPAEEQGGVCLLGRGFAKAQVHPNLGKLVPLVLRFSCRFSVYL